MAANNVMGKRMNHNTAESLRIRRAFRRRVAGALEVPGGTAVGGMLFAPLEECERGPRRERKPVSFLAAYIILVILTPIVVSLFVTYRGLPAGRRCPGCSGETFWLRFRLLRWVPVGRRHRLQRRWCPSCGWVGTVRVAMPAPGATRARETIAPAVEGRSAAEHGGTRARLLEVCELELDGTCWRVMLQAWAVSDTWRGRLLFVGPHGHLRNDVVAPFSGRSYTDVLGQAMALSHHVLAWRLREVISD